MRELQTRDKVETHCNISQPVTSKEYGEEVEEASLMQAVQAILLSGKSTAMIWLRKCIFDVHHSAFVALADHHNLELSF